MDFLPDDRRLFRPLDSFGPALRVIARKLAPVRTAKTVGRRWGLEGSTAENVTKGLASGSTVVKAVKAEGEDAWALWDALGELIIGESRDEFEERKLQAIIEETELARTRLEDRRRRRIELEGRTP